LRKSSLPRRSIERVDMSGIHLLVMQGVKVVFGYSSDHVSHGRCFPLAVMLPAEQKRRSRPRYK
jgi:hypothetical protein